MLAKVVTSSFVAGPKFDIADSIIGQNETICLTVYGARNIARVNKAVGLHFYDCVVARS